MPDLLWFGLLEMESSFECPHISYFGVKLLAFFINRVVRVRTTATGTCQCPG